MTDENEGAEIALDHNEWRGVQQLSNALNDFEPLDKRARLGPTIAERLVAMRLAEKGEVTERYIGLGFQLGYRLTELGWAVLDRGPHPRARRS